MSFQAYLDKVEEKTGFTPQQFIDQARERGYNADTKAVVILAWLSTDYGLGRGHGMALVHVIKNGPQIKDDHVGSDGAHRDASSVLRLDGVAARHRQG